MHVTNSPCACTCFPILTSHVAHQSNNAIANAIIINKTKPETHQETSYLFSLFLFFFFFCKSPVMNLSGTTTVTRTVLLFFFCVFLCSCIFVYYANNESATNWPAFCASTILVVGLLLTSTLVVVAARATVLAWITVLVLLAFAGKRRGVLVQQGRKITTDVVMYLFKDCA
ncbi:uncharacterized protein LOC122723898 [Manihot esculenta]|uniref:Uncharacterized protein n=1 Tax=Manihot esculenta TaxID=3983 RepID=A0A2C9VRX8_MANES|nr:uncharacterized protein LOC122723898 [Manihot esculenta]OAY47845.1 hypothetical protein MANES_06G110000v8 [Manihot esculenta]